jgi:hypothetical protein
MSWSLCCTVDLRLRSAAQGGRRNCWHLEVAPGVPSMASQNVSGAHAVGRWLRWRSFILRMVSGLHTGGGAAPERWPGKGLQQVALVCLQWLGG